MEWSDGYIDCPDESGGKDICLGRINFINYIIQFIGASAVYRMSAVLLILFLSLFLSVLFRNDCSLQYNEGAWTFRILFVFFAFLLFFFIDNSVFLGKYYFFFNYQFKAI